MDYNDMLHANQLIKEIEQLRSILDNLELKANAYSKPGILEQERVAATEIERIINNWSNRYKEFFVSQDSPRRILKS